MLGEPAGSDPDSRMCFGLPAHRHPLGKRFPRKPPRQLGTPLPFQELHHPLPRPGQYEPPQPPSPDQFIAWDRGCGAYPKDPRQQHGLLPGADASAIHGRTERSGCTAAEPYPLSRNHTLHLRQRYGQIDNNHDLKNNSTGLTTSLIVGRASSRAQTFRSRKENQRSRGGSPWAG